MLIIICVKLILKVPRKGSIFSQFVSFKSILPANEGYRVSVLELIGLSWFTGSALMAMRLK